MSKCCWLHVGMVSVTRPYASGSAYVLGMISLIWLAATSLVDRRFFLPRSIVSRSYAPIYTMRLAITIVTTGLSKNLILSRAYYEALHNTVCSKLQNALKNGCIHLITNTLKKPSSLTVRDSNSRMICYVAF